MPQHATRTSFKPGQKRTPESIEKQRRAIKQLHELGHYKGVVGKPWTDRQREEHAATKRIKAIGNRYKKGPYWQIMTAVGRRYEHRVIMEAIIGRPLSHDEHVHHKNHNGMDNRPENLELLSSSAHSTHHGKLRPAPPLRTKPKGKWSMKYNCCVDCGRTDRKPASHGRCTACNERRRRQLRHLPN